ncbi:MAG: HlyC/CorC family transporter [Caldilineaceae bacterium]|nr:HlyC/CorC family transporter [Caldilineaceae bacterium]
MIETLLPLTIIILLILFNGLFVAVEFAVVASSHTRLAQLADEGSGAAQRVLLILNDRKWQTRFIIMAQLGITLASLGLGMYGEHTIAEWILAPLEHYGRLAEVTAHSVASVIAIGLMTYLHVVLGEVVPKSIALQAPEATALRVIGPISFIERIFSPAIFVLNLIANAIMRLVGIPQADIHDRLMSAEELEIIVEESFEGGLIEPAEQLYIENILDMRERTVGQVMTPRTRIEGISVDEDPDRVAEIACDSLHSRYPIYQDDLDTIIGLLHIKDLARQRLSGDGPINLREMAKRRPVLVAPDTLQLDAMLDRFRREKATLAVVIDEFGGTAGIISIEDLIEEVVGEIQDEFDEESAPFEILGERELRVQGHLLLDELNQHFDLTLEHPEIYTVGGLIMTSLGRIPHIGDEAEVDGVIFTVESVDGRAVESVRVQLPEPLVDGDDPAENSPNGELVD